MSKPHTRFIDTLDHEGRFGEWICVMCKMGMAFVMMLPGDTLRFGTYQGLRDIGMNEITLAVLGVSLATFHAASLVVNGMYKRTPAWRGFCSGLGLVYFSVLAFLGWWEYWHPSGSATAGMVLGIYPVLAFAEYRGVRRAGKDAKYAGTY